MKYLLRLEDELGRYDWKKALDNLAENLRPFVSKPFSLTEKGVELGGIYRDIMLEFLPGMAGPLHTKQPYLVTDMHESALSFQVHSGVYAGVLNYNSCIYPADRYRPFGLLLIANSAVGRRGRRLKGLDIFSLFTDGTNTIFLTVAKNGNYFYVPDIDEKRASECLTSCLGEEGMPSSEIDKSRIFYNALCNSVPKA